MRAALPFAGAYMTIWALAGVPAYALDRPHGSLAAGAVVIAAGAYELTPVKRHFRRRCREDAGSGLGYGLCCADCPSCSAIADFRADVLISHGRFRNLKPNAANTKTIPTFAISRSQSWCLKNRTSTPITTVTSAST